MIGAQIAVGRFSVPSKLFCLSKYQTCCMCVCVFFWLFLDLAEDLKENVKGKGMGERKGGRGRERWKSRRKRNRGRKRKENRGELVLNQGKEMDFFPYRKGGRNQGVQTYSLFLMKFDLTCPQGGASQILMKVWNIVKQTVD